MRSIVSRSHYKLQLTKGFFADFDQIARMLTYAVEHGDEGRIPPEAFVASLGIPARRFCMVWRRSARRR